VRAAGGSAADVDRALTEDRSLVVGWLNRGTLHLVRTEDYWWLHRLTTPPLATGNARRLGQEGVSPEQAERGVAVIAGAVAEEGPRTRAQIAERLEAGGVTANGQAIVHLLLLASLRGLVLRGPMVGREQAWVRAEDWIGPPPRSFDRDRALEELARRYLAGHAPADDKDLAKWAGLPLGDARRGLAGLAVPQAGRARASVPPRLMGPFDPLLLGWASRALFVGEEQGIVTTNGLFRPFALVDGKAVAIWSLSGRRIEIRPFAPLAADVAAALEADGRDVRRFLSDQRLV
jgi:Winged helix DNA-binding domain